MNWVKLVEENREELCEVMRDRMESVLESAGRVQYTVYLWDDGKIECLEDVCGGNTWLKPNDPDRAMMEVATIKMPHYDWREWAGADGTFRSLEEIDELPEEEKEWLEREAILAELECFDPEDILYWKIRELKEDAWLQGEV